MPNEQLPIDYGFDPSTGQPLSLPVDSEPNPIAAKPYVMAPDLVGTQQQEQSLPVGYALNDAGIPFNIKTGKEDLPIIRRPSVLPIAKTPDGYTLAMPKVLDAAGSVMGPLAAGKVPLAAGEALLGSGAVRTSKEAIKYPLAKPAERWTNTAGQNDHLLETMTPDEFLNKGRPLKIDAESRETIDNLKKHIEEGKPLDPLEIFPKGNKSDIDGRHRALAAKELGIKEVPVLNFREPEIAPAFYSGLEKAVETAKPTIATADQWLGYLKNQPGVKSEELATVLKELPSGPITKEALGDIVKANKVELGEVNKGTELVQHLEDKIIDGKPLTAEDRAFMDKASTKFHTYQLPGGENYKEMLLTLPVNEKGFNASTMNDIAKELGYNGWTSSLTPVQKAHVERVFDNQSMSPSQRFERMNEIESQLQSRPAGGEDKRAALRQEYKSLADIERKSPSFKSSHWDEPNVLAHIRMNDRQLPKEFTPVEQEALKLHEEAQPKLAANREAQGNVGKEISAASKPLEAKRRAAILAENKAGKISNAEAQRQIEDYTVPKELKPLQNKLETLRKEETDLRKSLPQKPEQQFEKVLHSEEHQSDLHQQGRDYGYKGEKEKLAPEFDKIEKKIVDSGDEAIMGHPDLKESLKMAVEKNIITKEEAQLYDRYTKVEAGEAAGKTVPDLPFKRNWEELALKRLVRHAAENNYDAISWTPGEAQALRYQNDIRQKITAVDWHNKKMGKTDPEGNKQILVSPASGREIELTVDKNGKILSGHSELKGKGLDQAIGKDFAKQIMEKDEGSIDAKGYVMGAEGMKQAYDKRAVDIMNALGKKYGAKVEPRAISSDKEGWHITSPDQTTSGKWMVKSNDYNSKGLHFDTEAEAKAALASKIKTQLIHYMKLTPELKAKALKEGFPLFSSSPIITPVDHDPFEKKKFKLVPVQGNPFQ